jgi:hypothetical protein
MQQRGAANRKGAARLVRQGENAAVGQAVDRAPVLALGTPVEPLGVQHAIHLVRTRSVPTGERRRKSLCIRPPALEAGAVTGRKRSRLVEEEQLGITRPPNVSVPSVEIEAATNPSARNPASSAKGTLVAMEASAAIAEQQAARRIGKETAERIDAVGQRHWDSFPPRRLGAHPTGTARGANLTLRRAKNHAPAAVRPPNFSDERTFSPLRAGGKRFAFQRAVD